MVRGSAAKKKKKVQKEENESLPEEEKTQKMELEKRSKLEMSSEMKKNSNGNEENKEKRRSSGKDDVGPTMGAERNVNGLEAEAPLRSDDASPAATTGERSCDSTEKTIDPTPITEDSSNADSGITTHASSSAKTKGGQTATLTTSLSASEMKTRGSFSQRPVRQPGKHRKKTSSKNSSGSTDSRGFKRGTRKAKRSKKRKKSKVSYKTNASSAKNARSRSKKLKDRSMKTAKKGGNVPDDGILRENQRKPLVDSGSEEMRVGAAAARDQGPTQVEDRAQTLQLAWDNNEGPLAVSQTALSHTTRKSRSRSRDRSLSRSRSRLQIPGQKLTLVTPLFIRSFQTVRVEPGSDEAVITTHVILHSSGMTAEERKAELENLVQVKPAVVNVLTIDDLGYQEQKSTQNVLVGKNMIVVERKSILLKSEEGCAVRTNDVHKYDRVSEAEMGPSENCPDAERVKGILSVIAENGTSWEGDLYHKTERIVFKISGTPLSLSDIKTLPSRSGQSLSLRNSIGFDERIFADDDSIIIDRDTIIDAKAGSLWERNDPFYVEEKRSYDYQSTYADGSLVWKNALVPLTEEETQKSDGAEELSLDEQQLSEQLSHGESKELVGAMTEHKRQQQAGKLSQYEPQQKARGEYEWDSQKQATRSLESDLQREEERDSLQMTEEHRGGPKQLLRSAKPTVRKKRDIIREKHLESETLQEPDTFAREIEKQRIQSIVPLKSEDVLKQSTSGKLGETSLTEAAQLSKLTLTEHDERVSRTEKLEELGQQSQASKQHLGLKKPAEELKDTTRLTQLTYTSEPEKSTELTKTRRKRTELEERQSDELGETSLHLPGTEPSRMARERFEAGEKSMPTKSTQTTQSSPCSKGRARRQIVTSREIVERRILERVLTEEEPETTENEPPTVKAPVTALQEGVPAVQKPEEGLKTAHEPATRTQQTIGQSCVETKIAEEHVTRKFMEDQSTKTVQQPSTEPEEAAAILRKPIPKPGETVPAVEEPTPGLQQTLGQSVVEKEIMEKRVTQEIIEDEGIKSAHEPTPKPDKAVPAVQEPTSKLPPSLVKAVTKKETVEESVTQKFIDGEDTKQARGRTPKPVREKFTTFRKKVRSDSIQQI
ncbi:hypothetical protein V3C99_013094 [Haemonchus contortus]